MKKKTERDDKERGLFSLGPLSFKIRRFSSLAQQKGDRNQQLNLFLKILFLRFVLDYKHC